MHNSDTITEVIIRLPYINAIKDFVSKALNYSCITTLESGHCIVNARSIMGIFSLDLSQPITLKLKPGANGVDDRKDFLKDIADYVVA